MDITYKSKYLSQSELYEGEKTQMFTYVNNCITKLSIEKDRLNNSSKPNKPYFKMHILIN